MINIVSFLFHLVTGRLIQRSWGRNELLNTSTLLHERYRINKVHELGRDNPVYLAYDEHQDIDVAIKENAHHDTVYRRQFELEATILANMNHPCIPRAFDCFMEDGRQFFVMDYIEGINLQQLMQQREPSTGEILNWAGQLCDILSYLHSRKPIIIHRDVEPSNIILTPDGRIFLVDFGFAKVYRPEEERVVAVKKPAIPRSAHVEDREKINEQITRLVIPAVTDQRSDEYSLAATLYYLLTSTVPMDSRRRVLKETNLAPIRPCRPDLPAFAEDAIFRALSVHPNKRFRDIESFKSAMGM